MKTIYMSMPLSGYDYEERIHTVSKAKKKLLEEDGVAVYSPMENGLEFDAPREQHMVRDIGMLLKSDAIYLMRDWHKSRGCRLEHQVAQQTGKQILYELSGDKKLYGGKQSCG